MNKRKWMILILLSCLLVSSCGSEELKVSNTIKSPKLIKSPIAGRWILEEYRQMPAVEEEGSNKLIGQPALFKDNMIVVGDYFSENVTYSTKNVESEDYLLYKYKLKPDYLDINLKRLDIVSIYSDQQFILEIIKIKEDEIIIYKDNKFLFFKKQAEYVTDKEIKTYIDIEKNLSGLLKIKDLSDESSKAGILLGLKKELVEDDLKYWEYRTIYLKFNDLEKVEIYELDDILLPRKTGFYDVKVRREKSESSSFDEISVESRDERESLLTQSSNFMKNILYIGNDYISIENSKKGRNEFLRIYPLDYLSEKESLLLSEALDKETLNRIKKDIKRNEKEEVQKYFDERDFGLSRRNGYWTLIGRVDYKDNGLVKNEDYNIRAVTPKSIVNYDELSIPWSYIKTKIPELVDAFTSPNGDILIVQTYNHLKAYPIRDNKIINEEIFDLEIDGRESIIMNEWANGIYADLWEEKVLSILNPAVDD